jgi:hypothetical protein
VSRRESEAAKANRKRTMIPNVVEKRADKIGLGQKAQRRVVTLTLIRICHRTELMRSPREWREKDSRSQKLFTPFKTLRMSPTDVLQIRRKARIERLKTSLTRKIRYFFS